MRRLAEDRYDSLIQFLFEQQVEDMADREHFTEVVDWTFVKAQVRQESNFDPDAVSAVGARGLMQIMPRTWGADFERDAFNPEKNLQKGIGHLAYCWSVFKAEEGLERWKFALGAYNAGVGSVVQAQDKARAKKRPTTQWLETALTLPEVTGPDNARQTVDYVRRITANFLAGRTA